MNSVYTDIPRFCTAAAECIACAVLLFIFPQKKRKIYVSVCTVIFFVVQTLLLVLTSSVKINLWLPVMIAAVFVMYVYIRLCCRTPIGFSIYLTCLAFLQAELVASLEWQIHCYLVGDIGLSVYAGYVLFVLMYGIVFTIYYLISKNILNDIEYDINIREIFFVVLISVAAFALSNLSFINTRLPFTSSYRQEIFTIRTLIDLVGISVLYAYQNRMAELLLKSELNNMQTILDNQYQNFLSWQESIDVMNIKYHDLKHQIHSLRREEDPVKKAAWIDSLEKDLELYNINFDTGNHVLDTILSTKELQCRKHDVSITFMVNGAPLRMMCDNDVCNLFSNLLDNAIEAAVIIPEKDKRVINLEVSEKKSFLFIQCENYYTHRIKMHEGIPLTSKPNSGSAFTKHGFGVKSMKYTVKKYKGNFILSTDDNWFRIQILIPIASQ